jgi:hypothetical protein
MGTWTTQAENPPSIVDRIRTPQISVVDWRGPPSRHPSRVPPGGPVAMRRVPPESPLAGPRQCGGQISGRSRHRQGRSAPAGFPQADRRGGRARSTARHQATEKRVVMRWRSLRLKPKAAAAPGRRARRSAAAAPQGPGRWVPRWRGGGFLACRRCPMDRGQESPRRRPEARWWRSGGASGRGEGGGRGLNYQNKHYYSWRNQ